MDGPPSDVPVLTPATLNELQMLVARTPKLRVVAAGHSGDPWPSTTYLDVTKLQRPLGITETTVTCEAAMPIRDLIAFLATHNKIVEGLPSIQHATIGGTVIVGAHGSGSGVVSQQVVQVTYVLPTGQLLSLTPSDPLFPTFLVSAGLLGVLYSLTLRIIPTYTLYQQRTFGLLPLDPVGWLMNGLHRQLFYNPYTRHSLLYDHAVTPEFGKDHTPLVGKWFNNSGGEKMATFVYEHTPLLLPRFTDFSYHILSGRSQGSPSEVLSIPEYDVPYLDYEVAVPVTQAAQGLAKLQDLVTQWRDEQKYYLWFGIMLRYVQRDTFPLSPAYGSDVITFTFPLYDSEESRNFVTAVQEVLGTRWHLGKYRPGPLATHTGWQEFEPVRARYDPTNKFLPES